MRRDDTESLLDDLQSGDEAARKAALLRLAKSEEIRALPHMRRMAASDDSDELRFLAGKTLTYLTERAMDGATREGSPETRLAAPDPATRSRALFQAALLAGASAIEPVLDRLGTETDPALRLALITAVGLLGSRAHGAKLDPWLDDPDPTVRSITLEAMDLLGDPSSYPNYVRFAQDADPRVRRRAIRGLKKLGRARLVKLCAAMARSSRGELVRPALEFLGQMRAPEAVSALADLLRHPGADVAPGARRALESLAAKGEASAAEALAAGPAAPAPSGGDGTDEVEIPEGLGDEDPAVRWETVLAIEEASDVEALPGLLVHLRRERDPKIRATIVRLLGRIGQAGSHLSLLTDLLEDPHDRVRANAVEAYAQLTDPGARRPLWKMLKDPNNRVRTNAVLAMWGQGNRDVRDCLMALAGSRERRDRLSAVYAIHEIGEAAASLLQPLSEDADPEVRDRAAEVRHLLGMQASGVHPVGAGLRAMIRGPAAGPAAGAAATSGRTGTTTGSPGRTSGTLPGSTSQALDLTFTQELSSASFKLSAQLQAKVIRDLKDRQLRELADWYLDAHGGGCPLDEDFPRRLGEASTQASSRSASDRDRLLTELGERVRSSLTDPDDRTAAILRRLELAEKKLGEVEAQLARNGSSSRSRTILAVLAMVLVALVGAGLYLWSIRSSGG